MADPSGWKSRIVTDADIPTPEAGKVHVYWTASGQRFKRSDGIAYDPPSIASFNGRTGAVVPQQSDYDGFFLTLAEGNAAYDALGAATAAVAAHAAAGDPHPTYLTAAEGNAAYDALGAATSAVSAHAAAGDPHPVYLTAAEGNAAYPPVARVISTTAPLGGGGDLSANRTLTLTTSPTGQTPVGVTRSIATTAPLTGGGDLSTDRTLAISAATTSAAGAMSGPDKNKLDNLWYDVTNHGVSTGNAGAANSAALNALVASVPNWSTIYFPAQPALFYDFNGEIALNVDKRLRFLGPGKGRVRLRNMSATANLFNQSVAGFHVTFESLGFDSNNATTPKTAGAAILATNNNALFDIRWCEFTGQFRAIDFSGPADPSVLSPGNLSNITECVFNSPAAGGSQIRLDGRDINIIIAGCTANCTGVNAICLEIKRCGAVQVAACDFIGGSNVLLVNATGVVSALFVTNCFFDQATLGSTLKIMGTFAVSRCKFIGCGITQGAADLAAIEIAGTGSGTGIPEAIDFLDCDVYNNGFGGTTRGFLVTGCRGFTVRNSRVAGHTFGLDITPYSANGVTNFDISGNTIGPTENFAGNGTGIRINAGALQYGSYAITDNDLTGNTTAPLADSGAISAMSTKVIDRNLGLVIAAQPQNPAQLLSITTPTKVGRSVPLPAYGLRVGSHIRKEFALTKTATASTLALTLRMGTADSNADTPVLVHTSLVGTAAAGFLRVVVEVYVVSATQVVAQIVTKNGAFGATTGFAATHEQVTATTAAVTVTNISTAQFLGVWSVTTVAGNTSTVISDDEMVRY